MRTKLNYVVPLFLIPVVGTFGHYLAPNVPIFRSQDWGIVFSFVFALFAILL